MKTLSALALAVVIAISGCGGGGAGALQGLDVTGPDSAPEATAAPRDRGSPPADLTDTSLSDTGGDDGGTVPEVGSDLWAPSDTAQEISPEVEDTVPPDVPPPPPPFPTRRRPPTRSRASSPTTGRTGTR